MSSFTATKTEQPEQKLLILLWKRSKSTKSHTYNIDIFEEEEKRKNHPSINYVHTIHNSLRRMQYTFVSLASNFDEYYTHTNIIYDVMNNISLGYINWRRK